jgi:MoaA/NifB/PqqE/SkfB family radical SAM enzyme
MINWKIYQIAKKIGKRVLPSFLYDFTGKSIYLFLRTFQSLRIMALHLYKRLYKRIDLPVRKLNLRLLVWRKLLRRYQYPKMVSIFLTTRCNIRCFICRRENVVGEDFKFEDIYKLEKAIRYADTIELTGWGECFIYPRIVDVLKYIYSINPKDNLIQTSTNGTKLSRNIAELLKGHLKLLDISLNAATEETYNRDMKYAIFGQTLSATKDFFSALNDEDKLKIRLHFVAHSLNYKEIPDFVRLASDIGVSNVCIGNYFVGNTDHIKYSLFWIKEDYNKVIDQAIQVAQELNIRIYGGKFFSGKTANHEKCLAPLIQCYITTNGEVFPCCYAGSFRMGNVYKTSFEKVWFGRTYRRLRKNKFLSTCQSCPQFSPLDDFRVHFLPLFMESQEFKEFEKAYNLSK